jgi:hypothetical protein
MTQCEAVLSSVFLVIAPIAIAYLAHASKRSYLEMARSLIDYVKHYEERNRHLDYYADSTSATATDLDVYVA